jgi:hypothetical protein
MDIVYYSESESMQSKISKRKSHIMKSRVNQAHTSKSSFPVKFHKMYLTHSAVSCDNTWSAVNQKIIRNSLPKLFTGSGHVEGFLPYI